VALVTAPAPSTHPCEGPRPVPALRPGPLHLSVPGHWARANRRRVWPSRVCPGACRRSVPSRACAAARHPHRAGATFAPPPQPEDSGFTCAGAGARTTGAGMAGSRLASVPPADSGVRGELVEAEHAAGELKRTIARTLIAGARGVDGLASGVPVLGEAAVALDSAIRPGLRYTAMYPSRIDPSLPPGTWCPGAVVAASARRLPPAPLLLDPAPSCPRARRRAPVDS